MTDFNRHSTGIFEVCNWWNSSDWWISSNSYNPTALPSQKHRLHHSVSVYQHHALRRKEVLWTIFRSIPLPLNPIQISFHPSQTFHQCFHHFRHFQTLHHFVALSLVTCRFATHHTSHRHSIIPSSLFFIISFRHYHPSLSRISSTSIKFRASFSVMWLDDHHLTSVHSCGEQLLYCSSDLMT